MIWLLFYYLLFLLYKEARIGWAMLICRAHGLGLAILSPQEKSQSLPRHHWPKDVMFYCLEGSCLRATMFVFNAAASFPRWHLSQWKSWGKRGSTAPFSWRVWVWWYSLQKFEWTWMWGRTDAWPLPSLVCLHLGEVTWVCHSPEHAGPGEACQGLRREAAVQSCMPQPEERL